MAHKRRGSGFGNRGNELSDKEERINRWPRAAGDWLVFWNIHRPAGVTLCIAISCPTERQSMRVRTPILTAIFVASSFTLALAQAVPEGDAGTGKPGYKSGTSESGPASGQTPSSGAGATSGTTGMRDDVTGGGAGPNTGKNRQGK